MRIEKHVFIELLLTVLPAAAQAQAQPHPHTLDLSGAGYQHNYCSSTVYNDQKGGPYRLCEALIKKGVSDAQTQYFASDPDALVTILLPAGTFDLSSESVAVIHFPQPNSNGCMVSRTLGAIDVSGVSPGRNAQGVDTGVGGLIIKGAGMLQTVLITSDEKPTITGYMTNNVSFTDLALSRPRLTVTQGKVVSAAGDYVDLAIDPNLPSPLDISKEPDVGRSYSQAVSIRSPRADF